MKKTATYLLIILASLLQVNVLADGDKNSSGGIKSGKKDGDGHRHHDKDGDEGSSDEDDHDYGLNYNKDKKAIEVDLLRMFGEIQDWIKSDEVVEGIGNAINSF